MKSIIISAINLYQRYANFNHLFPALGLVYTPCKFHPTCSEYAKQSFSEHGFWRGTRMSIVRVLECNPLK